MTQPHGLPQCLRYNDAAARLRYTITTDTGAEPATPTGNVTCALYKADGTVLAAAANMTAETPTDVGYLKADAVSALFKIGEEVTGGTSGAKGIVLEAYHGTSTVTLLLSNVRGTFQNNEAITGVNGGAATVDGTIFSLTYYLDVATSGSTTNYAVGDGYRAKIVWTSALHVYTREIYFSIAYYPAGVPLWTTAEVDERQPTWARQRKTWIDWQPAINMAHAELVRRIRGIGEDAAKLIYRETELRDVSWAFLSYQIAESLVFPLEERDRLKKEREEAWATIPPLTKSTDTLQTADDTQTVRACRLVR